MKSDRLELNGEKKPQGQSQYKLPIARLTGYQASLYASGQGNECPNDDIRESTTVGIVSAPIW